MKRLLLLLASAGVACASSAQISVTGGTLTYRQNFDNLDTAVFVTGTNTGSTNLPAGWSVYEFGTSTTRVNNGYVGDNGASNTGDTYSYGTSGSAERALGSIASGSLSSHYGAKFVNNTGGTITGFTIQYRGEQWRLGQTARTNADSLRFYYSTTATGVSDTTAANYTPDNNLTFTTPNLTASVSGAMDGNASGNYTNKSGTIATTIANGGSLVIKWIDPNVAGSDDGLAIDSVFITFTTSGTTPRPYITSMSPAANATGVSTTSNLVITFDKNVTKGTGNIYIKNRTAQTTQTIAASSASVSISGKVATITGIPLQQGKVYHVTFDSTVFDTAGYHSLGIYDTTAWKFSTISLGVGAAAQPAGLQFSIANPVHDGAFTIFCALQESALLTATVYDLTGRCVTTKTYNATKGNNRLALHTALPAGAYIIRVTDGERSGIAKAILE